jgi:hypothetical protein
MRIPIIDRMPDSLVKHEHHSTSLEIMNGNCTLHAVLEKFPKFDVVEIYDNQSAVAALRRLACNSDSLNVHMD